jgi:hypothetical protein
MAPSPSWKAVAQLLKYFPIFYKNPKVRYRVHNSPQLVPTLSLINQVHNTPPYFSKINFNIIPTYDCVFKVGPFFISFFIISGVGLSL